MGPDNQLVEQIQTTLRERVLVVSRRLKAKARIPLSLLQEASYSYAPISFHFRLAVAKGTLDWFSVRLRTRLMETLQAHLGATTSRRELRRIARRHLRALRKGHFTRIWSQVYDFAGIEAIRTEGLEHLDEALAGGRGAILVSAHFGYGRMIKPVLRSRGRRALLVGVLPRSRRSDSYPDPHARRRLTRAERFARGLNLPRLRSDERRYEMGGDIEPGLNLRPHVEALERNEALIILADGRRAQAVHALPVAGIEISFAPGAVSIARSTGAALLPTFVVDEPGRAGPASLRLIIHPPLHLQITEDPRADHQENLRRFASVYEEQIRAYPHSFVWGWVKNGAFAPSGAMFRRPNRHLARRGRG